MRWRDGSNVPVIRRFGVGGALAVAAALAFAAPAASLDGFVGGDRPCTRTGPSLSGSAGDDVLCGTSGVDLSNGNAGNDQVRGFGGDDHLSGGSGNDYVKGGPGNDVLTGGTGTDLLEGEGGNDTIRYRDGELDNFGVAGLANPCDGGDNDTIDIDLLDFAGAGGFFSPALAGCDGITVGAVREGANVVISGRSLRVGNDGRTSVRFRCPRSLDIACKGSLTLGIVSRTKRTQPASRYSILPGHSLSVSVGLNQHDRSALRRSGRATGRVASVEKGHFGNKTTVKTVTIHT